MPRTTLRPLWGVSALIILFGMAMGVPNIESAILDISSFQPNVRQLFKIGFVVLALTAGLWGVLD